MAVFFLDTSAIVNRYVQETGTAWVQALTAPTVGNSHFLARITLPETIAAITRRERGGQIAAADAVTALTDFQYDFARQYRCVEITPGLIAQAAVLARTYALRGYDAVQLAAALEADRTHQAAGLGSVTLVSSDYELNTAAAAAGMVVDDPNSHP